MSAERAPTQSGNKKELVKKILKGSDYVIIGFGLFAGIPALIGASLFGIAGFESFESWNKRRKKNKTQ